MSKQEQIKKIKETSKKENISLWEAAKKHGMSGPSFNYHAYGRKSVAKKKAKRQKHSVTQIELPPELSKKHCFLFIGSPDETAQFVRQFS